MLAEVYSDFEENGGLEFKMLLNDVQKEVQQMRSEQGQTAAVIPTKTKEQARDELEEIEVLMEKLRDVKSRSERRRLLAQFNRKQAKAGIQWGQKATFVTRNELVAFQDRYSSFLMEQEQDEKLVWNPAVHGYVDKKLYQEA